MRAQQRRFLAEGWQAIAAAGDSVVEVFATPAAAADHAALIAPFPVGLVDDRTLAGLTDTVSPAGLVAVCRFLEEPGPDLWASAQLVVVAAHVRDPGNAGTILRTADAAGADAVVFAGDSVDPYNPKTVRATVGSLWHVPISLDRDPARVLATLRNQGFVVLAADGAGEVDLFDADDLQRGRVAWVLGNEAWGLPAGLAAAADHRVRIPILGRAESLNLGAAAAVCVYASARVQRTDR